MAGHTLMQISAFSLNDGIVIAVGCAAVLALVMGLIVLLKR